MHPRRLQLECPDGRARFAILALLIVGLAGCATTLSPRLGSPEASYVVCSPGSSWTEGRYIASRPSKSWVRAAASPMMS